MIQEEIIEDGKFCRHYSDSGKMIRKAGTDEVYSEAVDLMPCVYGYDETEIDIESTKRQGGSING